MKKYIFSFLVLVVGVFVGAQSVSAATWSGSANSTGNPIVSVNNVTADSPATAVICSFAGLEKPFSFVPEANRYICTIKYTQPNPSPVPRVNISFSGNGRAVTGLYQTITSPGSYSFVGNAASVLAFGLYNSLNNGAVALQINYEWTKTPSPAPSVSVSADKTNATYKGDPVNITWSSQNAEYCQPFGDWNFSSGSRQGTSGSQSINMSNTNFAFESSLVFTMRCYGDGGEVSDYVNVSVNHLLTIKPDFYYPPSNAPIGPNGSIRSFEGHQDKALIAQRPQNHGNLGVQISIDNGPWQNISTNDNRLFRYNNPYNLSEGPHTWKLKYNHSDAPETNIRTFIVDKTGPAGNFQASYLPDQSVAVWQNHSLQFSRVRKNAVYFDHSFSDVSGLAGPFLIERSINNSPFTTILNDALEVKNFDEISSPYINSDGTILGNTNIKYRVTVKDRVGNSTTRDISLNAPPGITPPISPANVTVTVKDNDGKSVPGANVTINPGSSFPASNNSTTFPINPGFPYSVTISGYDANIYSLDNDSDGHIARGEVRVDYQVSSENNNRNPMNCGTNQERCKQVLNHWMHGDINRTSNPSGFNNFISFDESDDSFTFVFNKAEELQPTLNSLSVSPSVVKSNEPVTITWTGENLVSCTAAESKIPANAPILNKDFWQGEVPITSSTYGSVTFNVPPVSQTTVYQLGLSCGENTEAKIVNNPNNDKSPILTVEPVRQITDETPITTTPDAVTIPKIPETKVAPNISGRVYDQSGKGIKTKIIINRIQYNTQDNGVFSISPSIHKIPFAGSYQVSIEIPDGFQSVKAVNARNNDDKYRYQVLGTTCTTNSECQTLFDQYGRQGDPVRSRIFDLDSDSSFEFLLSTNPKLTEPPIVPNTTGTQNNPQTPTTSTGIPEIPGTPVFPTLKLSADKNSINYGESVTLSWETEDAQVCVASGDWSGVKDPNYFETINNITVSPSEFDLTCYTDQSLSNGVTKKVAISIFADSYPSDITQPPNNQNDQINNIPNDNEGGYADPNGANDSNDSISVIPIPLPVLSCNPQGQNVKNVIKGATINVSDFIGNCTVSNVLYSVNRITSDNNKIPVDLKPGSSTQFVPTNSGSYEIMATSVDASGSYMRNIIINVFNPDAQEVSP